MQGGCPGFRGNLIDAGVVGSPSAVFYFTNAFDTVTQGVDVVGICRRLVTSARRTSPRHSITTRPTLMGRERPLQKRQVRLRQCGAEWRAILTLLHEWGPADILIRGNLCPGENAEGGSAISAAQSSTPNC